MSIKAGPFAQILWKDIEMLFQSIVSHPFVVQLSKGTLSKSSFIHYLVQDILYIQDDAKALSLLADRAKEVDLSDFFKQMSEDCISMEVILQEEYLNHFQAAKVNVKSPAIKDYTSFLLNHAKDAKFEVAAAALLPCFWVYHEVGKSIIRDAAEDNPYQKWINTYEGAEFEDYVQYFVSAVEHLASASDTSTQKAMRQAFIEGTKKELAFFEEAFNC